jgi:tape measure domain-containing protein
MAVGTPIAEIFARLALDREDFRQGIRESVKDMENAALSADKFAQRVSNALVKDQGTQIFSQLRDSGLGVAGALQLMSTEAGRFAVGISDTAVKTNDLGKALRTLGVNDIETSFQRQTQAFNTIVRAYDAGEISLRSFTESQKKFAEQTRALDNYVNNVKPPALPSNQEATEKHIEGLNKARTAYRSLAYDARSTGLILTAAVTGPIVALGVASFQAAGEIEVAQTSLTRLTGSSKEAASVLNQVKELSLQSPLNFAQTLEGVRRVMTNLRTDGATATRILRILTDTVSATGGGEESLLRIVKALSDVKNQGFLAGQEIRQFANANINVVDIIANQLGKTAPQVLKDVKDKAIDANTALSAIITGLDQRFGGEALARVQTLPGQLQQVQEQWRFAMADLGEAIRPVSEGLLGMAATGVKAFRDLIAATKEAPLAVKVFGASVAGLAASVGPILSVSGQVGLAILGISEAAKLAQQPMTIFGTSMTAAGLAARGLSVALVALPWVAMAGAIAFVGVKLFQVNQGLDETFNKFEKWKAGQKDAVRSEFSDVGVLGGRKWDQSMGESAVKSIGISIKPPKVINPEEAEKAAKKAAEVWEKAFTTLGIEDHTKKVKEVGAAYNLLSKSLEPLQKQSAITGITEELTKAYDDGAISLRYYIALLNKLGAGNNAAIISSNQEIEKSAFLASEAVRGGLAASATAAAETTGTGINTLREYALAEGQIALAAFDGAKKLAMMNAEMKLISSAEAKKTFDIFFGGGSKGGFGAASQQGDDFKTLGITSGADLGAMEEALARLTTQLGTQEGATRNLARGYVNFYRAAKQEGVQLTVQQEQHYQQLVRQLDGANRLERAWRGVSRQVSSVLNDFGKRAIEIFLPTGGSQSTDKLIQPFQDALKRLSEQGFSQPIEGLQQIISQIKNAASAADANRIALRAFGSVGPEIARGIRDGTLEAGRLVNVLKQAGDSFRNFDEGEKKISKFNQLLIETRNSVLRVFVEEGAKAIAGFVGTHLKNLINSMDGIIQKIPIIGKGLAGIFGNTAGIPKIPGVSQVPGVSQLPTIPIPGGELPKPPGSIPTGAGSPGAASGLGGLVGGLNLAANLTSAVAGIFSAIGTFRVEGTSNQIERNTAQASLFLGSRADGGILGQTFRISEYTFFTMKGIDVVGQRLNQIYDKIGGGGGGGDTYNFYLNDMPVAAGANVRAMGNELAKLLKTSGVRGRRA